MPSPPHTKFIDDRTVPLDDLISLPPSAYQAQLPSYSRGDKAPQSRNSTIIPDSVSRQNYTATNPPSQQQFVATDSEYRQERMFYAPASTERSQGRPTNPSTGRPGPSNYPSRPDIFPQSASRGSYQSRQSAPNDSGGHGRSGRKATGFWDFCSGIGKDGAKCCSVCEKCCCCLAILAD